MKSIRLTRSLIAIMLLVLTLFSAQAGISLTAALFSVSDGQMINHAGSLRFRAYQLLFFTNSGSHALPAKTEEFEEILFSPELLAKMDQSMPSQVGHQYQTVVEHWEKMKTFAQEDNSRRYVRELDRFIMAIDGFVLELEKFSRWKLVHLAAIQLLGLGLVLIGTLFAIRHVRRELITPLHQLEQNAESIAAGRFKISTPHSRYRELTTLGHTLSQSAQELDALYQRLHQKVEAKDKALAQAHERLQSLYQLSQFMQHNASAEGMQEALEMLRVQLNADALKIEGLAPALQCGQVCDNLGTEHRYPITWQDNQLGTLCVYGARNTDPELRENIIALLASSLRIKQETHLRERLSLAEERAVIARELHDSLGQLLAYMKIQLNLLRKANERDDAQARQNALDGLKDSTDRAYSQLRELLGTFRLKLTASNIKDALRQMLNQLPQHPKTQVVLHHELPILNLPASAQVHLVQLLREGVINAQKHAQASEIRLHNYSEGEQLIFSVEDNGIGMTRSRDPHQHFGLGIMHERARKMGAILTIGPSTSGGVRIEVRLNAHNDNSEHD